MPMPTRLAEKVVKGAKSICVVRCWSRLLHGSVPPVVRGQEAWLKRPKRIKYSMLMSLFSFINVQLGAWCPVRPGCLCKGEGLFVTEVPLCIFESNAVIWPYPGYLLRSVAGGGMPLSSTRNMECSCDTRLRSSAEAPGTGGTSAVVQQDRLRDRCLGQGGGAVDGVSSPNRQRSPVFS